MGGATPNLADLVRPTPPLTSEAQKSLSLSLYSQAMYGALSATEGLATFRDLQTHSNIGHWYSAVRELVNRPHPIT